MRSRYSSILGLTSVVAASVLGGCAELKVVHVEEQGEIPKVGAPYHLTFTQYKVTTTRRLTDCGDTASGTPQLAVSVEMTAEEVRDPRREYVIDLASPQSPLFNTAGVTVEYHENGRLKSINGNAESQAGPAVKSAFTLAGKLLSPGAGPVGTLAEGPDGTSKEDGKIDERKLAKCNEKTGLAVKNLEIHRLDVEDKTDALEEATAELKRQTDLAAVIGASWTDRDRDALRTAVNNLHNAQANLENAENTLKKTLGQISVVDERVWPENGEIFHSGQALVSGLNDCQLDKWFKPDFDAGQDSRKPAACGKEKNYEDKDGNKIADATEVWMLITSGHPLSRTKPCPTAPGSCPEDQPKTDEPNLTDVTDGLRYRIKAPGEVLACSTENCGATVTNGSVDRDGIKSEDVLSRKPWLISQLGHTLILPMKNLPFTEQTLVATFDDAGQPTKLGIAQTKAAGAELFDSAGALADEYIKYRDAREPKSELEQINEEIALLTAKAQLDAAKKALLPTPVPTADQAAAAAQAEATAKLTAETALLQAQIAKLKANKQLADARDGIFPSGGD